MEVTARTAITLLLAAVVALSFLSDAGVQGVRGYRHHHHARHTRHNSARPPSSSHAPGPASPRRAPSPAHHGSSPPAPPARAPSGPSPMPGAPAPAPGDGEAADNVYDVIKDFGAAGDGVTDDTDAIKTAWDTACQDAGEGVVVAAAGHSFLVRSTVFTGPCQGSVTLQVKKLIRS